MLVKEKKREQQILRQVNHHKKDAVKRISIEDFDHIFLANSPEERLAKITSLNFSEINDYRCFENLDIKLPNFRIIKK